MHGNTGAFIADLGEEHGGILQIWLGCMQRWSGGQGEGDGVGGLRGSKGRKRVPRMMKKVKWKERGPITRVASEPWPSL